MPLSRQNRVQPDGRLISDPARGQFMGNRGILHDDQGQLTRARWKHPHWITCVLSFKNRKRPLMAPGRYTELFFLDEAVACAAGHRPCAECRRADYLAFKAHWAQLFGPASAAEIDTTLHAARLDGREQRTFSAQAQDLPDATFLMWQDRPYLAVGAALYPYTPAGYGAGFARPTGPVTVLTPAPIVALYAYGWRPTLHSSLCA